MPFQERVPLITDGAAVNASTTNTPTQALDQNVRYLKQLLEQAALGQRLVLPGIQVEPDAMVGQPLYFNTDTQRFERALAGVDTDSATGALVAKESSIVWGLLLVKDSATSGDLLLSGYASLDLANAVDGTATAGWYFLSGQHEGKLVKSRPALSIFVLVADGNGNVLVQPTLRDSIEDHRHYKFSLVCRPAGDTSPPALGATHTITNADNTIEGWLPADDEIFDGKAPPNAVFGYNIAASALSNLWPPMPLQSAYLELNRGENPDQGGQAVPLGTTGQCVINRYGIWWLSDCYGDVPWRTSLHTTDGVDASEGYDDSDAVECPRKTFMSLTLWFTRMIFKTSGTVVTSLRAATGSLLSIRCVDGTESTTGDLEADVDLNLTEDSSSARGATVLKTLVGNKFTRGPVVEGVSLSGNNLTATASSSQVIGGKTYYQGLIDLAASLNIDGYELPVALVRLDNATEEFYEDVMSIGLASDRNSSIRCRVDVPNTDIPDGVQLKLRFWILGKGTGTTPTLTLSYRRIPRSTTATALPTTDSSLTSLTGVALGAQDEYYEVDSAAFDAEAGDTVFFTLTRSAESGDGYTDDVLLLKMRGVLVAS